MQKRHELVPMDEKNWRLLKFIFYKIIHEN